MISFVLTYFVKLSCRCLQNTTAFTISGLKEGALYGVWIEASSEAGNGPKVIMQINTTKGKQLLFKRFYCIVQF